jgi:sugar (pentulose or hexulose) kinase
MATSHLTFLALDLGTTTLKAAVLDPAQATIAHACQVAFPAPVAGLPTGWVEIDAVAVSAAARQLLEALLPQAPGCAGLLLCGQMGGVVLADARGRALSRYVSWRDQRALAGFAPADGAIPFDDLRERLEPYRRGLGNEVQPGGTLSLLWWLAQAGPLPRGALVCTLPDFVAAHLCGAAPVTHPTLAIGLLDLAARGWHHAAFEALGLGTVRWPRLAEAAEPVGQLDLGGRQLPCYTPVGDQPCALAGAGLGEADLSLNVSTGAQASRLTRALAGFARDYQTRAYFDGLYLNTITHLPAGRALNALLALLDELPAAQGRPLADPWPYLEQAAAALPATDLRVDLAIFPGPAGNRGAITNLHGGNFTLGHLFRAACENMAEHYAAAAHRLWPETGWQGVLLSGGLARRSGLLRRLIVAKLGGSARLATQDEETLSGLLALARVIAGLAPTVQAATPPLTPTTGDSP